MTIDIDLDALNKEILKDKKISPAEIEFAFKKRDIELKYRDLILIEIEDTIARYSRDCVNEILELYEKTKEGL